LEDKKYMAKKYPSMMHMKSKNLMSVEQKSVLSFFHFLPLFFFFILLKNLEPAMFYTSSPIPPIPFMSSPSPSTSPASFPYYNFNATKFLHVFN